MALAVMVSRLLQLSPNHDSVWASFTPSTNSGTERTTPNHETYLSNLTSDL